MALLFIKKFFPLFLGLFILLLVLLFFFNSTSTSFPEIQTLKRKETEFQDSVFIAAGRQYKKSRIFTLFFGEHYRDAWTEYTWIKELKLDSLNGGLDPYDIGGSQQTRSLKLRSASGKDYVARTVDKDQSRVLPGVLKKTILTDFLRDQTSALFPYAAPVVASLAASTGLWHMNPDYYYFPKQSKPNDTLKLFERQLVIVEKSANKTWKKSPDLGNFNNIKSTKDMVKIIFKGKKTCKIDTLEFLKCRIFDMLIGDWDRHAGQWKWGAHDDKEILEFVPLPKDRDMAFYMFDDGLFNKIFLLFNPKFQSFHKNFKNIKFLVYNGEYLDRLILSTIEKNHFNETAKIIQEELTDKKIKESVKMMPPEIYKIKGKEIYDKLISRRDQLVKASEKYYETITRKPLIVGSDKGETIVIDRNTESTIIEIREKNSEKTLLRKTLYNPHTTEINIQALGGDDDIIIKGKAKSGPIIKIYGGEGKDHFQDLSYVEGWNKLNRIYDSNDGELIAGKETKDKRKNGKPIELNRNGDRENF